jgi:hypothetical protein
MAGNFTVSNGLFIGPDGANFIGRGVNTGEIAQAVTNAACQPLTTLFPNVGILRWASGGYPSVGSVSTYIDRLVAQNIVVLVEDHLFPQQQPGFVQARYDFYAAFAAHYINEPFVWFGTTNEPLDPGVTDDHLQIYNAIRGTGSKAIVLFDAIGGGGNGRQGPDAFDPSRYANTTNAGWDIHPYAWWVSKSNDQNLINNTIAQYANQCKQITNRDGPMPVLLAEYGDSTDGQNVDVDWVNWITGVHTSGYGSAAWIMNVSGTGDILVDGNGNLTAYGQKVSTFVAAGKRAGRSGSTPTPNTDSDSCASWYGQSLSGRLVIHGRLRQHVQHRFQ